MTTTSEAQDKVTRDVRAAATEHQAARILALREAQLLEQWSKSTPTVVDFRAITDERDKLRAGEVQRSKDAMATVMDERDQFRKERDRWKANHDNQVKLKSIIAARPDLGDRAPRVEALVAECNQLRAEIQEARRAWIGDDFAHLPLGEALQQLRGKLAEEADQLRAEIENLQQCRRIDGNILISMHQELETLRRLQAPAGSPQSKE